MSNDALRLSIPQLLKSRLPDLLALYAFGSQIEGTATLESDLDLAVLVEGYVDPLQLWELSGEIADLAGCPVDLLDFRASTTIMQAQILHTGERWWAKNWQANLYEAGVLNDKIELDAARASLIAEVQREGRIYGR